MYDQKVPLCATVFDANVSRLRKRSKSARKSCLVQDTLQVRDSRLCCRLGCRDVCSNGRHARLDHARVNREDGERLGLERAGKLEREHVGRSLGRRVCRARRQQGQFLAGWIAVIRVARLTGCDDWAGAEAADELGPGGGDVPDLLAAALAEEGEEGLGDGERADGIDSQVVLEGRDSTAEGEEEEEGVSRE